MSTSAFNPSEFAFQWHDDSDHGRDGAEFGSITCNCEKVTDKVARHLAAQVPAFDRIAEDNEAEVFQWEGSPWYAPIKEAHDLLTRFIPGYRIAQIKEKFGGLRFYTDLPDQSDVLASALEDAIVMRAEQSVEHIRRRTAAAAVRMDDPLPSPGRKKTRA